jgi:hypothetical protein
MRFNPDSLVLVLNSLLGRILEKDFKGKDPYGAFFRPSISRIENDLIKRIIVQVDKRFLHNFLSPRFEMVVTKALTLTAMNQFTSIIPNSSDIKEGLIREICNKRNSDGGWGYEYDTHFSWGSYTSDKSNVIATFQVLESLKGHEDLIEFSMILELLQSFRKNEPYFSYAATELPCIHNANLLAASMWLEYGGDASVALRAVEYSMNYLNLGTAFWPYGEGKRLNWSDTFHTGYNLLALSRISFRLKDNSLFPTGLTEKWCENYLRNGNPILVLNGSSRADIHTLAESLWVGSMLQIDYAIAESICAKLLSGLHNFQSDLIRWELASSLRAISCFYLNYFVTGREKE